MTAADTTPMQRRTLAARRGGGFRRPDGEFEREVIGVLYQAGRPLTTLEVAQVLRQSPRGTASRLSRLADYGKIHREHRELCCAGIAGGIRKYCLWSLLPASPPIPSIQPPGQVPQSLAELRPGGPVLMAPAGPPSCQEGQPAEHELPN